MWNCFSFGPLYLARGWGWSNGPPTEFNLSNSLGKLAKSVSVNTPWLKHSIGHIVPKLCLKVKIKWRTGVKWHTWKWTVSMHANWWSILVALYDMPNNALPYYHKKRLRWSYSNPGNYTEKTNWVKSLWITYFENITRSLSMYQETTVLTTYMPFINKLYFITSKTTVSFNDQKMSSVSYVCFFF